MNIKYFVLGFVCVMITFESVHAGRSESSIASPRLKKHKSEIILSPQSQLLIACLAPEVDLNFVVKLLEQGADPLVGFKPLEKIADYLEPIPVAQTKSKKKQGFTGKIFSGRSKKRPSQSTELESQDAQTNRPMVLTNWDLMDNVPNESTPLHIAALRDMPKLAEYLMNYKTKQLYAKDSEGNTPLHVAIINNNREVFDVIMTGPEQFSERKRYVWDLQKSFTIFNSNKRNVLHAAIINGGIHTEHYVKKLVLAGINLNWATKGSAGRTPYELALQHQRFKVAIFLVVNGAHIPENKAISGKVEAYKMNQLLFSSEALKLSDLLNNEKTEFLDWLDMQNDIMGQFLFDYNEYKNFGQRIQKPGMIPAPKKEEKTEGLELEPRKSEARGTVKSLPASSQHKRPKANRFLFTEKDS